MSFWRGELIKVLAKLKELQPLDATLTSIAGLTGAADKGIYFTGADTAALFDLTAAGRALLDDANAAAQRTTLGLGTAATQNIGTSGANVPLLNAFNTWGDSQAITTASTNSTFFQLNNGAPGGQSWAFYSSGGGPSAAGNFGIYCGGDRLNITPSGLVTISNGSFSRGAPVTKTADFTVAANENWLINNKSGSTCTVTLPTASSFTGREILIKTIQAQAVVSASSNVVPVAGGAAGTAILAATPGKWAKLVSNGTNWEIMAAN